MLRKAAKEWCYTDNDCTGYDYDENT